MTLIFRSAAVLSCLALAACGGSSSEPPTYQELGQRYNALVSDIGGVSTTPTSAIPTSGSASYAGVGRLNAGGADGTLLGTLQLTTPFSGSAGVTGRVDDLVNASGEAWSGAVNMAGGPINRSGSGDQFAGSLSGSLVDPAGSTRTIASGSTFRGSFAGAGYDYVLGDMSLGLCTGAGGSCADVTGNYVGER